MKLFKIIYLITSVCLLSCNDKSNEVADVDFEKIVLISLDSSIRCEMMSTSDSINLNKLNYGCFVVDSLGNPLFKKTHSVVLNELDRNFVKHFFLNLKKDSTEYENLPALQSIFRDAVLLYKHDDTLPSVVYHLDFSMGQIESKKLPQSAKFAYRYPEIYYDLAPLFVKNGLKSKDRMKNWR